jgi:hypothetical protein
MIANPDQVQVQSKTRPTGLVIAAVDHAVRLTHQVCCLAGTFDLLEEFRDPGPVASRSRRMPPRTFPEAKAPQPDHNVHGAHSGLSHIIVGLGSVSRRSRSGSMPFGVNRCHY